MSTYPCDQPLCNKVGVLLCTACRTVRYCSVACQKQHWRHGGHKETCASLKKTTADTERNPGIVLIDKSHLDITFKDFGEYIAQFSSLGDDDAMRPQKYSILKKAKGVLLTKLPHDTPISGYASPDLWESVVLLWALSFARIAELFNSLLAESKIKAERSELSSVLNDADRFLTEALGIVSANPDAHSLLTDVHTQHALVLRNRAVQYFADGKSLLAMGDMKKASDTLELIPNRDGWGGIEVTLPYSKKLIDARRYQEAITLLEDAYSKRCQESVSVVRKDDDD